MKACQVNLNSGKSVVTHGIIPCGAEAAYTAWTANCNYCLRLLELEECTGHPVCIEHGAALRTTALPERAEKKDETAKAVLLRLCSLDVNPVSGDRTVTAADE